MAKLRVEDLVVAYGAVIAVSDISFTVEDGEFVSLLGPSGCGKTTTLRCIAGLEGSSGGTIRLGDAIMAADGRDVPPDKRGINMVFQSYAVWPHMIGVRERRLWAAYPARAGGRCRAESRRGAEDSSASTGFADRYGTELSGGQQQRVALARAVVTSPRLLLFDEPLSNLDAGLRDRMRFELVELQRRLGQTSLYVTHDQSEAMLMSDRIILMKDGRIVQSGTPRDLYERPASRFAAEFIGNANIVDGRGDPRSRRWHGAGGTSRRRHDRRTFLPAPMASARSGPVLACIRAESISRVSGDEAGTNCFDARVESLGFLGPLVTCTAAARRGDASRRTAGAQASRNRRNHSDPDRARRRHHHLGTLGRMFQRTNRSGRTDMRIESIESIFIDKYFFVEIRTDNGLVGLGEGGAWGFHEATAGAVTRFKDYLLGQDPLRIEHHWQYMYRWAHFRGSAIMAAISAIDIALWDIAGKHFEAPVHALLGGKVRDKARAYYHVFGETKEELFAGIEDAKKMGFTAVGHLTPFLDSRREVPYFQTHAQKIGDAIDTVREYRKIAGREMDLCIEIHRQMTPYEAVQLGRGDRGLLSRSSWRIRSRRTISMKWPMSPTRSASRSRPASA